MEKRIRVLSEDTINQIAAGEVIENPSSVVKELVENSLDAKATSVSIEIIGGGFQLIRISDNGTGMSQDDALLSFERHATSKIQSVEDLFTIDSMGFRGEALASIASISKMTMTTCLRGQGHQGVKILCEAGNMRSLEICPRSQGTTIEVRSLFYTVPARKKFQKSPAQAVCDIHKVVSLLALSRPDVEFKLLSQDKVLLEASSGTFLKRIQEVLGKEYAEALLPVVIKETPSDSIKIEGFIGNPLVTRSNRTGQYFFINKRGVHAPSMSYAVSDGYGTMLSVHRHPLCIMQLTLSPDLIDVNVHPQKKEVRFKEESYLKDMLRQSVARSLQKKHTPMTVANFKGFCQEKDSFFYSSVQKESQDVKPLWSEEVKESLETLLQPPKQNVGMLPWEVDIVPKLQDLHFIGMYRHYALIEGNGSEGIFSLPDQQPPYTGLLMVDLKACTTRIYFDQVMHEQKEGNSLEKQLLLFPVTIHVAPSEASLLQESLQDIEALGISIRSFGTCSFVIDACLPSLDEEGIQELIYECIEDLKIQRASSREIRKKLALKAARIAGVANKRYDVEEAKKILSHLLKTETPYFCPFGKKTIAYISVHSYEKFFIKDSH